MIGNATPIELAWTACALIGLIANGWGFLDALADRRWLRDSGLNGRREIVATWHVRLNGTLAYIQALFLVAGVVADLSPAPPTSGLALARAIVQLSFITAEPALVVLAIEARRYRGRLLATRTIEKVVADDQALHDDDVIV